jgi:hypothetical protein
MLEQLSWYIILILYKGNIKRAKKMNWCIVNQVGWATSRFYPPMDEINFFTTPSPSLFIKEGRKKCLTNYGLTLLDVPEGTESTDG